MTIKRKQKNCLNCKQDYISCGQNQKYCYPCIPHMRYSYGKEHFPKTMYSRKYRKMVILMLGSRCKNCHNLNENVLEIDHVNNDGKSEKIQQSTYYKYITELSKEKKRIKISTVM